MFWRSDYSTFCFSIYWAERENFAKHEERLNKYQKKLHQNNNFTKANLRAFLGFIIGGIALLIYTCFALTGYSDLSTKISISIATALPSFYHKGYARYMEHQADRIEAEYKQKQPTSKLSIIDEEPQSDKIKRLKNELKATEEQQKSQQKTLDNLNIEHNLAIQEIESLKKTKEDVNFLKQELEEKFSKAKEDVDQLRLEFKEKPAEKELVLDSIQTGYVKEYQQLQSEKNTEIEKLNEQINVFRKKIEDKDQEIKALIKSMNGWEKSLETNVKKLNVTMEKLENNVEQLKSLGIFKNKIIASPANAILMHTESNSLNLEAKNQS